MFKNYADRLIFISAFLNFKEFKKHTRSIAWETEVWIVDVPDHMIHFNGDKFLNPC
jgi:type II restriction enzyme